ncbi:helix-turn-helix and ligand-binding sensor domain-containing protein [Flavobacterium luteum]|uniref:helix-turn-helix and ligand-binding sensor domain-containing protein n=1 Tax=Flavobacterium luteum TaxID=2026654 RepID=UPI001CDA1607|nr:histidine kinase [Flavobacterium luteum]
MRLYLINNTIILKYKSAKILFFILFSLNTFSQDLLPFVENYSKYNYQGDNQIWSLSQGKDNAIYFANNHYFLRYDGVKWEKYMLPNKTIIRSVLVVGNKIYTGSYKEFGYWHRSNGKMIYFSISKSNKIFKDTGNEEIWKIVQLNNKIYFQSFNEIYILENGQITDVKLPFQISYCFPINGELLLATINEGIVKMNGTSYEEIENWSILKGNVVHSIEKNGNNTYIFTQKNGVYVADESGIRLWDNALNSKLKGAIINCAKFINQDKLIVGTASEGVYSIDMKNNSYININRNNMLMNNSVLSIAFDKENDLWLGLDNGVAHVEINSPVSIFTDNTGTLGSVYSVAAKDNGFLLASNHGIFNYENNSLTLLPNSKGQAWNISKINNQYVIGHNEGTFLYKNKTLTKINAINGGWNFTKSNLYTNFLQASYSGVTIYKNENDFSQYTQIKDFYKPIKYVAQNKMNEIWAADNYRGLYRVIFDEKYNTKKIINVAQQNNISNDFGVKIFEFRNEILFFINNTWYTYNSITNLLERNSLFNSYFKNISDIVAIDNNNFLVLKSGLLYVIHSSDTKFIWNLIQEKYYRGKLINDNLKIFRNNDQYLLNLDDGFIILQLQKDNKAIPVIKVEAYNNKELVSNKSGIKYNTEIELHVVSGIYGSDKPNLFYKINDQKELIPIKDGTIILNNLNSGSHKIVIYFSDGITLYEVSNYQFKVDKPWYFSFWMIAFYLLAIAIILFLYYKWNKIRYNQKLALKEEELRHQKRILEIELQAENELNVQEYEKHILELEIQTKSSEVAGKSLSIAKQSEMIENIQQILDNEFDINKLKSEIKKAIKINAVNKQEWKVFENNLNQIHNEFIKSLSTKYPLLTSKDIKLCVYLKMNLSSKEIAPLMNISFRSVELHRYRLRKKLALNQDKNLNKFLLEI